MKAWMAAAPRRGRREGLAKRRRYSASAHTGCCACRHPLIRAMAHEPAAAATTGKPQPVPPKHSTCRTHDLSPSPSLRRLGARGVKIVWLHLAGRDFDDAQHRVLARHPLSTNPFDDGVLGRADRSQKRRKRALGQLVLLKVGSKLHLPSDIPVLGICQTLNGLYPIWVNSGIVGL